MKGVPVIRVAALLFVVILTAGPVAGVRADVPAELGEALRRGRLSEETVTSILRAAEALDWDDVPAAVDMDAVALSLAYAEREGRLSEDAVETAHLALDLAREAAMLGAAGFSPREVARTLTSGLRAHLGTDSVPIPAASRVEAARAARDRMRGAARAADERRREFRPGGVPAGVGPPGEFDSVHGGVPRGSSGDDPSGDDVIR